MVGILILGAIVIVAIFAVLAYIVIKIWFTLIKSKEKDHHSNVHNKRICKEGPVFLSTEVEI